MPSTGRVRHGQESANFGNCLIIWQLCRRMKNEERSRIGPSLTELKQSSIAAIDWIGLRVAGSRATVGRADGWGISQSDRESLNQELELATQWSKFHNYTQKSLLCCETIHFEHAWLCATTICPIFHFRKLIIIYLARKLTKMETNVV